MINDVSEICVMVLLMLPVRLCVCVHMPVDVRYLACLYLYLFVV